jgi:hypothetical protein
MKKSLFLYLFIIAILMNIFTYAYFTKQSAFEKTQLEKSGAKYKDSLVKVTTKLSDADYFSLENNQNAQNYFDTADIRSFASYGELSQFVKDKLIGFNDNPKGNPFTGQEQMGGQKFIINKVKVLNHRWIIADYSDGNYWGEVLLKYFINPDETVSFEVIQSILHQKMTE